MEEQIKQIKEKAEELLKNAKDSKILNDLKVEFLGKKGELTSVLRGMKELSAEERPKIGEFVNKVKANLEQIIE